MENLTNQVEEMLQAIKEFNEYEAYIHAQIYTQGVGAASANDLLLPDVKYHNRKIEQW